MDYGRDVQFGVFITPAVERADAVVALAEVAESAGLDLVTFQDHPYQPAFVDTWTLISYVAARTSSVRLAGNVLNLPLRPPFVLARSVASLDRLSGGRIELGLGSGAFWDAIAAAGGRRLTASQAVDALAEAIAVIRGVWDVDNPDQFRVDGEYYRVAGAKRGPAPAHDVGIWLGAYKPRMLALTGHAADGWLPSLGYLRNGPADLAEANARIDDAASSAARSPADIRRLLNISGTFTPRGSGLLVGPAEQWAEELADLTLAYGTDTFILATDDAATIERFAAEVAPRVREIVAAERSTDTTAATGSVRGPRPTAVTSPPTVRLPAPTPDAGTRLRARSATLISEVDRPTRHTEGTDYTAAGAATASHLIEVHDYLRQELASVRDVARQVLDGSLTAGSARSAINDMTMRQNDWTLGAYCAAYCRLVTQHHSLEDAQVFPHLRRADPELGPVLDQLEHEHDVIHAVLDEVDAALVRFVAEPDGDEQLSEAIDVLTDVLTSHLSYEERELMDPLARVGFYPGQV